MTAPPGVLRDQIGVDGGRDNLCREIRNLAGDPNASDIGPAAGVGRDAFADAERMRGGTVGRLDAVFPSGCAAATMTLVASEADRA